MTDMLKAQIRLQKETYGVDLVNCSDEDRMRLIRENTLALIDELMEAIAETGWKPWASSNHINRAAWRGELVDAWHFFMNLMALGNMSLDDLEKGYYEKRAKNAQRQREGYDGVATKCMICKRALDDSAVSCDTGFCDLTGVEYRSVR